MTLDSIIVQLDRLIAAEALLDHALETAVSRLHDLDRLAITNGRRAVGEQAA